MFWGRTKQSALTIVVPLRSDTKTVDDLTKRLRDRGQGAERRTHFPFEKVPQIHFARWVVLAAQKGVNRGPHGPKLLFEANYDGRSDGALIDAMLRAMGPAMHDIYSKCVPYADEQKTDRGLRKMLLAHRLPAGAFHVAHYGRTVPTILAESKIRNHVESFFDAERSELFTLAAEEIRERARAEVDRAIGAGELPELPKLFSPPLQIPDPRRLPKWILGALLIAGGPVSIAGYLAFRKIRALEIEDEKAPVVHSADHIAAVSRLEDIDQQNPLTHVVEVKPGGFRLLTLRVVLFVVKYFARLHFNRGDLGGIRSIHFARWVIIDKGQRLLFFSNYDGSWERYLGDFIDQAAMGLTAVWSNTEGFPQSEWLLFKGSTHEDQFKAWTRARQIDTQLWFTAYPQLSNREIEANAKIRRGLERSEMKREDAKTWLSYFLGGGAAAGSATTKAANLPEVPKGEQPPLAKHHIQAMVLTGLGDHLFTTFLVVDLGPPGKTGPLLQSMLLDAKSLEEEGSDIIVNVGFTRSGLDKLGLSEETIATFGPEFQDGIAKGTRPATLGDVGDSDPSKWEWGTFDGDTRVDAVFLVYAKEKDPCEQRAAALEGAIAEAGGRVVWQKHAEMLDERHNEHRKEHFGFVDGISQPKVRGLKKEWTKEETVAAGEFVFGYPNSYVDVPDAPTLRGSDEAKAKKDPAFADCVGPGKLGANGTYVVARDLRQDVAAFRRFIRDQSKVVHPTKSPEGAMKLFEAECIGRSKEGVALSTVEKGDLTFADDVRGEKCPITAHIRRSNPRDSLTLNPAESRIISDRHRILRRGRNFGEFLPEGKYENDDVERGMFFMCVNTNIARQFEFIQQTWLQSTKFGGLRSDRDPLLGREPPFAGQPGEEPPAATMTVATSPVRARVPITPFVTVRGGGYFFVPSLPVLRFFASL